jgi:hypothetical protein
MNEPKQDARAEVSEEFLIRVNDMLEMANRIERRFDTAHAQMVMLHAFSRYAAHHFRSTVKQDSAVERNDFAVYLGNNVAHMMLQNIEQLSGPAPQPAAAAGEPAAE